jgi:hypothetical protein
LITFKWSFPRMGAEMNNEIMFLCKCTITLGALTCFFSCMSPLMFFESPFRCQSAVTLVTLELSFS